MFAPAIAFLPLMTNITRMFRQLTLATTLACLAAIPAMAASSQWHEAEGGRVRLVTAGPVSASGELRGALQIDLKPGWKTYWRDPGSSGVPPQIDVSPSGEWSSATLDFPAPQRHEDVSGTWAGYDYSVSLPVLLKASQDKSPAKVTGSVFLGVCEKICVPLQAPIDLTIDAASTPAEESSIVDAAWSALPAPATSEFGVVSAVAQTDTLEGAIKVPGKIVDLFVAGENGFQFGEMAVTANPDQTVFKTKVLSRPKAKPNGAGLAYTLVTDHGAVSGTIPYP